MIVYSAVNDLREIYLTTNEAALKGKAIVDDYVGRGDLDGLSFLLRNHLNNKILPDETYLRDDVDNFLEYFSILGLAVVVQYLSKDDLEEYSQEIEHYLGNPCIYSYYYFDYPIIFPQLLYELITGSIKIDKRRLKSSKTTSNFVRFHLLNESIRNENVDKFLWFLDGGKNKGFGIADVKNALGNSEMVFELLSQTKSTSLTKAIKGFVDYLLFLEKFDFFLKSIRGDFQRAVYWAYHDYWFSRIVINLKESISQFHIGMLEYTNIKVEFSDSRKSLLCDEIEYSKHEYDRILTEVLYTEQYRLIFMDAVKQWRRKI